MTTKNQQMKDQRAPDSGRRQYDQGRIQELEKKIAELAKVQEAQAENKSRLVRAQRLAHVGDWEMDLITYEQHWSRILFEILGLPEDIPASYDSFKRCLHPDDRDAVIQRQDEMMALGEGFSSEFRILRQDGEVCYIRTEINFEYDDNGKPVRLVGIDQDITERKKIEIDLREAKIKADFAAKAKTDFLPT